MTPGAYEPIVDVASIAEAQKILEARTNNKSNSELLDNLRALLAVEGGLSLRQIKKSVNMASPSAYQKRFGTIQRAYELIGYGRPDQFGPIDLRRRTMALREQLFAQIVATFPDDVSIIKHGERWRSRLRLSNDLIV